MTIVFNFFLLLIFIIFRTDGVPESIDDELASADHLAFFFFTVVNIELLTKCLKLSTKWRFVLAVSIYVTIFAVSFRE